MILENKKRILVFSVAYLPFIGGAEVAVKELTDRLGDYDFDLVTVNLDGKQKAFEKVGRVNVYRIGRGAIGKYLFPIFGFLKASRLHKKNSYDLTWAIMANYAGLAGLFFKKRFSEIPLVLTLQEGDPLPHIKKRMGPLLPLFKLLFEKADRITAISNYLADWGREMGARCPVVVVPNGVDGEAFRVKGLGFREEKRKELGYAETDVVVVTTSRLVEKNAVDDIIGALPLLPSEVKLLIVGAGELEESLKSQAAGFNLGDRVKFVGFVSHNELPKYLQASDIFVRPSRSEGMGISFVEAMAAGLPIIATPVGGIVDFLKDKETGLFCGVNDPNDLAHKVQILLRDKTVRDYIVTNASKMVANSYNWNNIVDRVVKEVFAPLLNI